MAIITKDVVKTTGFSEQDVETMYKTLDILAMKQPDGVINVTVENYFEHTKQVDEVFSAIKQGREDELTTLITWESQWKEFFNEQYLTLMKNESNSVEMKKFGLSFLNSIYRNMEDVLHNFYQISAILSKFEDLDGKQLLFKAAKKIGCEIEELYGTGDKSLVKRFDENSYIQLMSVILPHDEPIVFPIVSYDTTTRAEYRVSLEREDYNFEFSIELNGLNPKALDFTFFIY
ncbi:hypothetical protein OCB02_08795 [Bacillus cereus]|uniref:hypothetical protein n=1 Tax=Bacillus cereus TaxID=1396 RepID=UPI001E5AE87E|nr:hypothetical protein [Bacillus cereus]MCU5475840.1 hypothetical protein [Bacillus cereus]MCU5613135.1 hypothetical protein [Bacillus cereus]